MSTQVFEAADINFMISSLLLFLLRLKLFELLREARNLQAYPNWRTVLESASSLTSEGYTVEEMKEMILHQAMQTNYSLMSRQLDNSKTSMTTFDTNPCNLLCCQSRTVKFGLFHVRSFILPSLVWALVLGFQLSVLSPQLIVIGSQLLPKIHAETSELRISNSISVNSEISQQESKAIYSISSTSTPAQWSIWMLNAQVTNNPRQKISNRINSNKNGQLVLTGSHCTVARQGRWWDSTI